MTGALHSLATGITRWSAWILGAAALMSMLSPSLLLSTVVLGLFLAAIRWVLTKHFIWRTPTDWVILLLLLLLPLAVWVAPYRDLAAPQALRLVVGVLIYYSAAYAAGALGQSTVLAAGVTAIGVLLALAGPVAAQLSGFGWLAQMAPAGIVGIVNPNVLAGALLPAAAFPLAVLFLRPWRRTQVITAAALACAALLLGVLVLTQSRGALMGMAALLLVLAICRVRPPEASRRSVGLLGAALLGGSLLVFGVMAASVLFDAGGSVNDVSGMELRLEIWSRAQFALQDFPLTGVGIGNFGKVVNLLYPLFLVGSETSIFHAHNLFLQVALDLGMVGLVAWLASYMLALAGAWRMWRSGRTGEDTVLGAALLAGLVAVAVHGLTDAVMWGVGPAWLLWAIWGLALGNAASFSQPPMGEGSGLPPGQIPTS